ncbi:protein of unknown function [Pseudomonas sp. JV551A1]|uniref:Uncharacterized protein n=1 Tax=Pseudomonas inefficax TaxID=2078786 RepID=A0AAQ1PAC8_9PSED|nr:protein of unknown function [Pseudomonas sp. JV551A1]SPO62816.1 protein of unknown function [Pseudomonas inefficax]
MPMPRRMPHCAGLAHKVHRQRQQRWRGSDSSILWHRQQVREVTVDPVGAGLPAKIATRYMAPALPVFAGKPAPTGARAGFQMLSKTVAPAVSLPNQ